MYETIIVGAGAAGLFHASVNAGGGLILEAAGKPATKLKVTGNGQCNYTRTDDIRDFIEHYGDHGKRIRSCLYKFNNEKVIDFFQQHGIRPYYREDGKVFPASMKAEDVSQMLLSCAKTNGWTIKCNTPVTSIEKSDVGWIVNGTYKSKNVVIATGGYTWGNIGLGDSMYAVWDDLDVSYTSFKPALVPIKVENYPYTDLSGISFTDIEVTIWDNSKKYKSIRGDLLFAHSDFTGPAVLNISRYAAPGREISINYGVDLNVTGTHGVNKTLLHYIAEETGLPERFCRCIIEAEGGDPNAKASTVNGKVLKRIKARFNEDRFLISGTAGPKLSMVSCGGVLLDEISTRTFELKKFSGLYVIGEALDVDGDTGGYNLQFAWSSAAAAAENITRNGVIGI